MKQRIATIHHDLTWHFGPQSTSEHRLTVAAAGIAEVRPAAERWLGAAPAADETWEFRSSQAAVQNALDSVREIAGGTIGLSKVTFHLEPVAQMPRLDIGIHHPMFLEMPEFVRQQITFLVLDWHLGEEDVERRLDGIEALETVPVGATDGVGLVRAVA